MQSLGRRLPPSPDEGSVTTLGHCAHVRVTPEEDQEMERVATLYEKARLYDEGLRLLREFRKRNRGERGWPWW